MNYLQSWIEELNPLASLPSIAILFLIAIIAGWYVGNLIQWFRRWQPHRPASERPAKGRCDHKSCAPTGFVAYAVGLHQRFNVGQGLSWRLRSAMQWIWC